MTKEASCPYCDKVLSTFKAVRAHTSKCSKNTGEYSISAEYGPIHYTELTNTQYKILKNKYPNISLSSIVRKFKEIGLLPKYYVLRPVITKDYLIKQIQHYVNTHGHIPSSKDFNFGNCEESCTYTYIKYFGSWNSAIEAAGYIPNIQNGYGTNTKAIDGNLYRSQAEAYFVDNFLFGIYEYIVEPSYPEKYNKIYDWYIPSLDLYIELDGGIRPEITKQKIEINKLLNRHCLFIPVQTIYNKKQLTDFI